MDIERFFLFVSLSLSTLFHHFHPTSKKQHSRLFYIIHHPATNTSLNKRRSAVHAKKEFLSLCCQSLTTHTHTHTNSRYSGICLLGNVVSGKTYRQLNEQASEEKDEERKTKRERQKDYFFDAGVSRWW
jgi:hypothetical protein